MNEEKLISVIIPIYNSEKYLRECLDSVVNQSYKNLEILLINDGSTDSSLEICRGYANQDSRVRVINQKNGGEAIARNKGLCTASGEFVLFVDSDDLLLPRICEKAACEIKECDVLIFDYIMGDTYQHAEGVSKVKEQSKEINCSTQTWGTSLLGPYKQVQVNSSLNTAWGKLYRREFLENHRIRCSEGVVIGTDLLLNLQIFLNQPRVCNLPAVGYFYRYNPASVVHRYNPKIQESYAKFQGELKRILSDAQLWDSFQNEVGFQKIFGMLQIFSVDIFHKNNPKSEREKKEEFLGLVKQEEYQLLFATQLKNFALEKRIALIFAKNQLYYPLKVMYSLKARIRNISGGL